MLTLPLAHAGHWIESVLYVIPLVALVVIVVVAKLKDRAAERQEALEGGPEPDPN